MARIEGKRSAFGRGEIDERTANDELRRATDSACPFVVRGSQFPGERSPHPLISPPSNLNTCPVTKSDSGAAR